MFQRIHDNLYRQRQAMILLQELLLEEYALVLARDTTAVVALEFSIHELVRQLAREKSEIIRLLEGGKLLHYVELLPGEQGDALRPLYTDIDAAEQAASRQASRNAELSLALLDQSQRIMQELHNRFNPPTGGTYGRSGSMDEKHRPSPSYISGRL